MKIFRCFLSLSLLCSYAEFAEAAIKGRITNSSGNPASRVWVYTSDESEGTYTDGDGRFLLADVDPPIVLFVFNKNYAPKKIEVRADTAQPVQICLPPRRGLSEEVTVTARSPRADFSPVGAAANRIERSEISSPASTLVSIIESVPGIAENGQGGHLKV